MSDRAVLHLVRAGRSAPLAAGDRVIAVDREGRFHAPPGAGAPEAPAPGPIDASDVVAMLFECDVVVVW